jgi:hypothetical protein
VGGHRNIFIEDGLVVIFTKYHKEYALSGDVKFIHRYLARELGELVVWYLWLVRTFERRLQSIIGGPVKDGLDEDHSVESKAVRLFCRDGSGREWMSSRMRQALDRATSEDLGHALHIQAYGDVGMGISRRYMRGSSAFSKDEECQDDDGEGDKMADLQGGHGWHVAGWCTREACSNWTAVASRREQFHVSSIDWHRFLAIQSAMEVVASQKRKGDAADVGQREGWARLQQMKMRRQFRRMIELEAKEGRFRGVQEQGIEAIQSQSWQQARASPCCSCCQDGQSQEERRW